MDEFGWEEIDDSEVCDKNGVPIKKGQFVYFSKLAASVPMGNYRCEGFMHGSTLWSKPGIDFYSSEFTSEYIELLSWKRWKNPKAEQMEMVNYIKPRRDIRS